MDDMRSSGKEFTIEVLHFVSELKAAVTLLPGAKGPGPVSVRGSDNPSSEIKTGVKRLMDLAS